MIQFKLEGDEEKTDAPETTEETKEETPSE